MTSNRQKLFSRQRLERRFLQHHLVLALVSAILITAIFQVLQSPDSTFRLSMATAYTALALLGATLLTGPWNLLLSRPNQVSTDLRRDLGIWAGVIGLTHFIIGLQVHMGGKFWLYFLFPSGERHPIPLRYDPFGFANYTGLIATVILAVLLALSNDVSLRRLGARRWKSLQRWNYGLFVLVVLHGFAYQLIEKRQPPYPLIFGVMVAVVILIQLAGFWKYKQQLQG